MPIEAYQVADESLVDGTPLTREELEQLEAELRARIAAKQD